MTPSDRAATASARLSSRGSRRWLAKLALGVDRHNAAPLINVEESLWHCWIEAEPAAEATMDRRADVVGGPEDPPERIATLAAQTEAEDEVIAATNTFDPAAPGSVARGDAVGVVERS